MTWFSQDLTFPAFRWLFALEAVGFQWVLCPFLYSKQRSVPKISSEKPTQTAHFASRSQQCDWHNLTSKQASKQASTHACKQASKQETMTMCKKSHSIPTAPSKENNTLSPLNIPLPPDNDDSLSEEDRPKWTQEAVMSMEDGEDEMSPNMIEMKQSACNIMHRSGHGSKEVFDHCFRAHFGTLLVVSTFVWELFLWESEWLVEATMLRFLWSLMLMMIYDTEEVNCMKAVNIDEQTFCEWAWFFIHEISYLEAYVITAFCCVWPSSLLVLLIQQTHCFACLLHLQIVWENQKCRDKGNDCLVSIDRTDCPYEAKGKELWSYKFWKTGLRYLVALCIKTGDIVYINGPFPPGKGGLNDLATFCWGITGWLKEDEQAEAGNGYLREAPWYIKCLKSFTRLDKALQMEQNCRSHHEMVNSQQAFEAVGMHPKLIPPPWFWNALVLFPCCCCLDTNCYQTWRAFARCWVQWCYCGSQCHWRWRWWII